MPIFEYQATLSLLGGLLFRNEGLLKQDSQAHPDPFDTPVPSEMQRNHSTSVPQ